MEDIEKIAKIVYNSLSEQEKDKYSTEIIIHVVLLYFECKEDYESNYYNRNDPGSIPFNELGESMDKNIYIKYIEDELEQDKIIVEKDVLIHIMNIIRKDYDEYHPVY